MDQNTHVRRRTEPCLAVSETGRTRAVRALFGVALLGVALPVTGLLPTGVAAQTSFETTEVAIDLYRFRWQNHNGMFLVTDDGVVVVDPINVDAARQMAAEIRRIAPDSPLSAIVYSHSDADHSTGGRALMEAMGQPDVPIIAHELAVAPIRERSDPEQPLPTVTFAERMELRVGGREIQLHYLGRGHTDNMIVPYFRDAGVAFAVDFVANDRMGYRDLAGWYFPDFFEAVSGLLGIPFDTIVFGHGPDGDRASIHRQIAYYDDLTAAVRDALARGWSEDQAAGEIRLEEYSHWDQYEEWFPMNVRGIYRWLVR
jgi:glyoxylase-like metal-dependent hydrolase (beta-lactamase superfamily II)